MAYLATPNYNSSIKLGMKGPFPVLFSYRPDRIEEYERAGSTQDLHVQTQADA
jgi:hypothetical protein